MKKSEFEQKCYEAYKLDWMISHNVSIDDVISGICDIACEAVSEDPMNAAVDEQSVRELTDACRYDLFNERGFGNGCMWVCKDEFLGAEFKDPDYMLHLISMMPNSKEMEQFYRVMYSVSYTAPKAEVFTTAGVIRAYENTDPDQPGIDVMLQPAGYEDEIDVAYVTVYENSELATDANERPEDVVVFSYGDATTEDYTVKEIIRREDVIARLGTAALH